MIIKKFVNFFKGKESEPIELDTSYLRGFINDVISPLKDVDGLSVSSVQKSVPSSNSKKFRFKFSIKLSEDEINKEDFLNEMCNILSHLKSEDLYILYEGEIKIKDIKSLKKTFNFEKYSGSVSGGFSITPEIESMFFWEDEHEISIVHNDFIIS